MFFFKSSIIFILLNILFLGSFLNITTSPEKVDTIFALGEYDNFRILQAIKLLKESYTTTNKIYQLSTQKQKLWLSTKTPKERKIIIENLKYIQFSKDFNNTLEELKYIEEISYKNNYKSIIIITDPTHSKRVDFLIKKYTKISYNLKYLIVSSNPTWWNNKYYFLNFKAFATSLLEIIKIAHNYFKYSIIKNTFLSDKIDEKDTYIKKYLHKNFNF